MLAEVSFDHASVDLDVLQLIGISIRILNLLQQCIDIVFGLIGWKVENIFQRKQAAGMVINSIILNIVAICLLVDPQIDLFLGRQSCIVLVDLIA